MPSSDGCSLRMAAKSGLRPKHERWHLVVPPHCLCRIPDLDGWSARNSSTVTHNLLRGLTLPVAHESGRTLLLLISSLLRPDPNLSMDSWAAFTGCLDSLGLISYLQAFLPGATGEVVKLNERTFQVLQLVGHCRYSMCKQCTTCWPTC